MLFSYYFQDQFSSNTKDSTSQEVLQSTNTALGAHHGEPLALADHAHMLFGVRHPVFTGWGLVRRLELGRRATFFPR